MESTHRSSSAPPRRRARRIGALVGLLALALTPIAPIALHPAVAIAEGDSNWPFSLAPRSGARGAAATTEKAASVVPVEFRLGGYRGSDVLVTQFTVSIAVDCHSRSPRTVASPPFVPANGVLTYDTANDTYTFWWPRGEEWEGTCRRLILKLADGSVHPVLVYFGETHTALLP